MPRVDGVEPAVLRCVPHRAPILRIVRIVTADGECATTIGREPIGPGTLPWALAAIEGLAQSAAIAMAHAAPPAAAGEANAAEPPRGMLVAVKRLTVTATPRAEADITYHVRIVRRIGPTTLVAGRAECDGQRLAEGELMLWATPPPG